ncbi:DUF2971 domain-containing protein [Pseudomonas leptonychotis]|uniref:DUF2971 domain-containing protein n=1 Tax=Pseudomonas leptonychotis TaxID=2448482 RepID=A0A4T2A633_9PSED|nr:DUF2971 domain-containing protein [Pseudomonas leptonychotis]TIH10721.1 DUF2971 domain-containing protein [Pseudomonas leptonychotis]
MPEIIYKYESFSAQSLKNLKAQSIYFGSPLGFNDPYDCALSAGIAIPTDEELDTLKSEYQNSNSVPENVKKQFAETGHDKLRDIVVRSTHKILESHARDFLKTRGVSCFSECNDDLLMWSHYGGKYKGFCLAFSTKFEPFSKMVKVKYTRTMPKINAIKALLNDNFDEMLDLFCTKSKSWEYEKEWRCMHEQAGTLYTYEADALESVYFWPDIDSNSLEIVCLILAGQNQNVRFWRGNRSQERFEVIFEEFTYTSYLEAKRRGRVT